MKAFYGLCIRMLGPCPLSAEVFFTPSLVLQYDFMLPDQKARLEDIKVSSGQITSNLGGILIFKPLRGIVLISLLHSIVRCLNFKL